MTHHRPTPSELLRIYQALLGRMYFPQNMNHSYQNELKGYEGEMKVNQLIKKHLKTPFFTMYGLLYEDYGTFFQPDTLLFTPNQLHLLEIKNYEGEFTFHDDYLYSHSTKKYYRNPIDQLNRGKLLLQNMFHEINIPLPLQANVIFVNPSFTLFQAEKNPNIILPTQLKGYFQRLNNNNQKPTLPREYLLYKDKLLLRNISKSPFTKFPDYNMDKLQKGILCRNCRIPMNFKNRKSLFCFSCNYLECMDSGILRMMMEFQLLFPNKKITTSMIDQWCGNIVSTRTMNRVLNNYLTAIPNGRSAHFVFK